MSLSLVVPRAAAIINPKEVYRFAGLPESEIGGVRMARCEESGWGIMPPRTGSPRGKNKTTGALRRGGLLQQFDKPGGRTDRFAGRIHEGVHGVAAHHGPAAFALSNLDVEPEFCPPGEPDA